MATSCRREKATASLEPRQQNPGLREANPNSDKKTYMCPRYSNPAFEWWARQLQKDPSPRRSPPPPFRKAKNAQSPVKQ